MTEPQPDLLTRLQAWLSDATTAWKRDAHWLMANVDRADDLMRDAVAELTTARAEIARLHADIDKFWFHVERAYDIEPRAYFEKEARTNGFASPLAQAAHHIWKRDPKVAELEAQVTTLTAALRRYGKHEVSCDRGKVKEPVKCPSCGESMLHVRNTNSYLINYQFDAVKAGDWFCKRHEEFVYVWDSALEKSPCTCGFDAALRAASEGERK